MRADEDSVLLAETLEPTVPDVAGDDVPPGQVLRPHPPHQRTRGIAGRGRHDLALDRRRHPDDPVDRADLLDERVELAHAAGGADDTEVTVYAEDASQELGAQSAHPPRHDDNRRHHTP